MARDLLNKAGSSPALALIGHGLRLPHGLHFKDPAPGGEGGAGGGGAGGEGGAGDGKGGKAGEGAAGAEGDDDDDEEEPKGDTVSKEQYEKLLKESKDRRNQIKALKEAQKNNPTKEQLAEYQTYLTDKAKREADDKKAKGKYEELLADQGKKHADELAALKTQLDETTRARNAERVSSLLGGLIPQYTAVPVRDVAKACFDGLITVDEDGDFVLKDPDTNEWPISKETGKEMTPEEFVAAEIGKRPYMVAHKPAGGSGGGNQKGGGRKGEITEDALANMSISDVAKNKDAIIAQVDNNRRLAGQIR